MRALDPIFPFMLPFLPLGRNCPLFAGLSEIAGFPGLPEIAGLSDMALIPGGCRRVKNSAEEHKLSMNEASIKLTVCSPHTVNPLRTVNV